MIIRINLIVSTRRILDLAGPLVIYTELRITLQVLIAENNGIYHILIGTTYTDDILSALVFSNMLSNMNGGI